MQTALQYHQKNTQSISSASSGVGELRKSFLTGTNQRSTFNGSSIYLRKSATSIRSGSQASSARRSGYSDISTSAVATASQLVKDRKSPKVDAMPFSQVATMQAREQQVAAASEEPGTLLV